MVEEKKEEKKKIIIDEDWKQEAQKEKEVLAAQEKAEVEEVVEQKADEEKAARGPLPKGDFAALVSMLVTQTMFSLGLVKVEGHDKEPDLEIARYNIDMLESLQEKTEGNLSEAEQKVLSNTLNEIRMAYVKVAG